MRISDWSSDVCSSDLAQRRGHEAGNRAWRAEDGPNPLDFTRESVLAKLVRDTGDAARYVFTVDGSRERRETAVNSLRFGSGHFAPILVRAAGHAHLDLYTRPARSLAPTPPPARGCGRPGVRQGTEVVGG